MKLKLISYKIGITIFGFIILSCNNEKLLKELLEYNTYCLPNSEFAIAGIEYGENVDKIKNILPEPIRIVKDVDFNFETWIYKDYTIDFYNREVWSVKTESEKYSTPSGLRPGLSKSKTFKMLGFESDSSKMLVSKNGLEYQFVNCEKGNYMILIFSSEEVLERVEFDNDIP